MFYFEIKLLFDLDPVHKGIYTNRCMFMITPDARKSNGCLPNIYTEDCDAIIQTQHFPPGTTVCCCDTHNCNDDSFVENCRASSRTKAVSSRSGSVGTAAGISTVTIIALSSVVGLTLLLYC